MGEYKFSLSLRGNCCILRDLHICLIRNKVQVENSFFFLVSNFAIREPLYNVGYSSDVVELFLCKNLSATVKAVDVREVKSEYYVMSKWQSAEGREEIEIEDEFVCVLLLTPIVFSQLTNIFFFW